MLFKPPKLPTRCKQWIRIVFEGEFSIFFVSTHLIFYEIGIYEILTLQQYKKQREMLG